MAALLARASARGVAGLPYDKVLHAWRRFATATAAETPPVLASVVTAAAGLRPSEGGSPGA